MSIWWLLLLIPFFIFGIFFLVIYLIVTNIKKNSDYKKGFETGELPNNLKQKVEEKLSDFNPPPYSVLEIVKNISLYRNVNYGSGNTLGGQTTFFLYPLIPWQDSHNYKGAFLKGFRRVQLSGANFLDINNTSCYVATKIQKGKLETFFVNKKLAIKLDGKIIGCLDYESKKITGENGNIVGYFTRPELLSFKNIGGYDFEIKLEIFFGRKKVADIYPNRSQKDYYDSLNKAKSEGKILDLSLFSNVEVSSENHAILLLGIGVAELCLLN